METTGAQWLPFVHESILSYSRVSLVHESILSYSWVFPFQQWHPTNASQRGREHFVYRSAHVLNYLGLCRLRSFQSAALQADASESTTLFQGLFLPFLGDACLSSSVAFFNTTVSLSQDTQEQATWERELEQIPAFQLVTFVHWPFHACTKSILILLPSPLFSPSHQYQPPSSIPTLESDSWTFFFFA